MDGTGAGCQSDATPVTHLQSKTVASEDKYAAIDLLEKGDPPRQSGWDWITEQEWRRAQTMRAEALEYLAPARARFSALTDVLELALARGSLVARLQPAEGGPLGGDRPSSEWHVPLSTLRYRLISCRMDAAKPLAIGSTHWIFVSRAGLTKIIAEQRKRANETVEAARPLTTLAHLDSFKARVRDAVLARPDGPSERETLIREGRDIYRLSKEAAEEGFKQAIDTAGVPHQWSKPGRPKKK
jgi:hypothetical protein